MTSIENKVVVITGASSGIGRAAAHEFVRKGARVVLAARRMDALQALCRELDTAGNCCLAVRTDVTKEADVERLFHMAEEHFGQVDVLVNNAGRGLKSALIDTDLEQWLDVIQTNLTGVYICTRLAARSMAKGGIRGHIITVGSVAGLYSLPGYAAYSASKHGVTGFQRSVRWELRKLGIRTSTIFPFRVDTEFFDTYPARPSRRQMLPAREIAGYIVALATRSPLRIVTTRLMLVLKRICQFMWPDTRPGR